jgi:hypothetical protein
MKRICEQSCIGGSPLHSSLVRLASVKPHCVHTIGHTRHNLGVLTAKSAPLDQMASAAAASVHAAATPNSMTQLRACKSCHLIKTRRQFYADGCDNCPHEHPSSSRAGEKEDYVQTRTSAAFTG